MNARVVTVSPDGRSLTVAGTDGHSRTMPVEPGSPLRLTGLRMGDEILVTARGGEDALVVTAVKVVGTVSATTPATGAAMPVTMNAFDYVAARRQRPNPYSLINPMFPRESPKNPWSRRRLMTTDGR